jgi:ribokinase
VRYPDRPTGTALIVVEKDGRNTIVVSPGCNLSLGRDSVRSAAALIADADCVVLQLEIPLSTVREAVGIANRACVPVVMNLSPVNAQLDLTGMTIDYLVVNEVEAEQLADLRGRDENSLTLAAERLAQMGAKHVIITRGSRSTLVDAAENIDFVPTIRVTPMDTVGAGDTFTGALAVALSEGMDLLSAVRFANCAAALAVTKPGAQTGMPCRRDVENCLIGAGEREPPAAPARSLKTGGPSHAVRRGKLRKSSKVSA